MCCGQGGAERAAGEPAGRVRGVPRAAEVAPDGLLQHRLPPAGPLLGARQHHYRPHSAPPGYRPIAILKGYIARLL